ncbi:MAG TPA: acyl carrier protein [Solirubrobacterales bacterium]|jgi:acyl carrier protein|nr:acyl carrier protein [Solirubrobacterales bacterium]
MNAASAAEADKALTLNEQIRQVIRQHAHLTVDIDSLSDEADLYQAGMTSHASVNVMIALEDTFDVEFLDSMLKRSVFESVGSIERALSEVGAATV